MYTKTYSYLILINWISTLKAIPLLKNKKIICKALIIAIFIGCITIPAASFTLTEKDIEWLEKHPGIKIGLMSDYPPQSSMNKNGLLEGIDPMLFKLLDEMLPGRFKIESGTWSNLYLAATEKRLDVLMNLTPSKQGEKFFRFTRPYMSIPHEIVAKTKGRHFSNIPSLNGHIVALEKHSFMASYLRSNYPGINIIEYEGLANTLKAVQNGQADAYIGSRMVVEYAIKINNIDNLAFHSTSNETSETKVLAVRSDWPELQDILDRALASIAHEKFKDIMDYWAGTDARATGTHGVILSDEEINWIKNHPEIRVGAEMDWPPYDYVLNGKAVGFSNDYLRLLAQKAGLTLRFVHGLTWDELLENSKNKKIDVLPNIIKLPEREEYLTFTRPFLNNTNALVINKNQSDIHSLEDMQGKTLAQISGFAENQVIRGKYPGIKPVIMNSTAEALMAVSEGRIDGYVDYPGVINYLRREHLIYNLRIATLEATPFLNVPLRVGIRKDWVLLTGIFEKAMDAVTQTEYEELKNRWLFSEAMGTPDFSLTPAEKDWIKGLGTLKVFAPSHMAPFYPIKDDILEQGIYHDYLKIFTEKLGLEIQLVSGSMDQLMDSTREGKIDLVPLINDTKQRREILAFTKPLLQTHYVIATKNNAPYYPGIDDLAGLKVGIERGNQVVDKVKHDYPEVELIYFRDTKDSLLALDSGEISALLSNNAIFSYYIGTLGLRDSLRINNRTEYKDVLTSGVRKGLEPLVPILNRVIAKITEKEHDLIMDKWINLSVQDRTNWKVVWQVVGTGALIIFMISFWSLRLTREIKKREQSENRLQLALDGANAGLFYFNMKKNLIVWDDRALQLFGLTSDQLPENMETLRQAVYKDDRTKAMQEFEAITSNRKLSSGIIKFRTQRPDGELRNISASMSILRDKNKEAREISGLYFDITNQIAAQDALKKRLDVEKTISKISSRFITMESPRTATGIDQVLKEIGELFEADRSYLFMYHDDFTGLTNTHEWCANGVNPHIDEIQDMSVKQMGRWETIKRKESVIAINSISDLPDEAQREKKLFQTQGIKSQMSAQLKIGETFIGFIALDSVHKERIWEKEECAVLSVFADIVSYALNRWQNEEKVQALVKNKETLIQEINHRVKNNLAALISIVHLEQDKVDSGNANMGETLADIQNRLESLSVVHQLLSSQEWSDIKLCDLAKDVIQGVLSANTFIQNSELSIKDSNITVNSTTAHHLALVFNELTTNSIKYALKNNMADIICVELEADENQILIEYSDNGIGFPENIIAGTQKDGSIGFELIKGIIQYTLEGRVEIYNNNGAHIKIYLPND